ncbi:MAG: mechanosensitive ion channel [Flavobacteriaceae bacterium]|nr:mechanosensitive ion channel [Flavobacteriaceae bacterium]
MIESILQKLSSVDYISIAGKILGALLVLFIGLWIIKMILKGLKVVLVKKQLDKSLQGFLMSLVGWGLRVFLFIAVAGELGIETTSFAAVIAAAGLAIGMALQGSLSNFAGGTLIMVFKPFRAGDFIDVQGQKGTVKKIEIFTTTLNTTDNKEIIIPNGILSNGIITNYSSETNRRVDLLIGVSYDANIKKTKEVLLNIVNNHPLILKDPAPAVMLLNLNESSVDYEIRSWVKNQDYWAVYSDVLEKTKEALDQAGIEIPYPHVIEIQKKI